MKIFPQELLEKGYNSARYYIVSFRTVYQIYYSEAQRCYYTHEIYYSGKNESAVPLTKRGQVFLRCAGEVNSLINKELLKDESTVYLSDKYAVCEVARDSDIYKIYERSKYDITAFAKTLEGVKEKIRELEKNA